jgi:hypothetical protein
VVSEVLISEGAVRQPYSSCLPAVVAIIWICLYSEMMVVLRSGGDVCS